MNAAPAAPQSEIRAIMGTPAGRAVYAWLLDESGVFMHAPGDPGEYAFFLGRRSLGLAVVGAFRTAAPAACRVAEEEAEARAAIAAEAAEQERAAAQAAAAAKAETLSEADRILERLGIKPNPQR